jgi:DNA-binding NarL/FixJ family response regulator
MLSPLAISILLLAGVVVAICFWMRRSMRMACPPAAETASLAEIDRKLAALRGLITLARRQTRRLEAAIAMAQSLELTTPKSKLAAIEELGNAAALEDPLALQCAAAQMTTAIASAAADSFRADEKTLRIVRLLDQGHSISEIARRVGLPLGEVEFRLSLRS